MTPPRLLRGLLLGVNGVLLAAFLLQVHGLFLGDRDELALVLPDIEMGGSPSKGTESTVRRQVEETIPILYAQPPVVPLPRALPVAPETAGPLADWRVTAIAILGDVRIAFVELTPSAPDDDSLKRRRRPRPRKRVRAPNPDSMIEGQRFRGQAILVESIDPVALRVVYRDLTHDRVYTVEGPRHDDSGPGTMPDRGSIVRVERQSRVAPEGERP